MSKPSRCLLVHVPKMLEWSGLIGWYSRINFVPNGLWAIADALDTLGLGGRILHVGIEKQLDRRFSLSRYVRRTGASVVAFSLQWHPQLYDVLEAARQLKEADQDLNIVVGGLTASYFASDILQSCPWIDAVIRGDGGKPLVAYVQALEEASPRLEEIENLTWRASSGEIRSNPLTYVATEDEWNGWSFARLDLLDHAGMYLKQGIISSWEPEEWLQRLEPFVSWISVPLALGIGPCQGQCPSCAGSRSSMWRFMGRRSGGARRPERIVETVRTMQSFGCKKFWTCFDLPNNPTALLEILDGLGTLESPAQINFEPFGLPSREMILAVKRNLHPSSRVLITVDTANERIRKLARAFPFTNAALEETLAFMDGNKVEAELYFTIGLPTERRSDIEFSFQYEKYLSKKYSCVKRSIVTYHEMEPGAPWFEEPDKYHIRLHRRTLKDFCECHRKPHPGPGYDTAHLSASELEEILDEYVNKIFGAKLLRAYFSKKQSDYSQVRDFR